MVDRIAPTTDNRAASSSYWSPPMHLFDKYLARARDYDEGVEGAALSAIDAALHMAPQDAEAMALKGDLLVRTGFHRKGAAWLRRALRRAPNDRRSLVSLADVLLNHLGSPARALSLAERVISDGQADQIALDAFRLKAEALVDLGRLEEAGELVGQALTTHPEEGELLFLDGWLALQRDRPFAAATRLRRLLSQDPVHADAHYYLGWAYEALGEPALMRRQFSQTFELDLSTPPQSRFRFGEFEQLVTLALAPGESGGVKGSTGALYPVVEEYPDEGILSEFPHDPRCIGVLLDPSAVDGADGLPPGTTGVMVFFQWNVERLCFTRWEAIQELRQTALQEQGRRLSRTGA